MPRRRRDNQSEGEEEDEDEEMDELERAEHALEARRKSSKGKGKASGSSKRDKHRSSRGRDERDDQSGSDGPNPDEEDEDDLRPKGKGKAKLSESEITDKAKMLVRLAICNEASKRPLRREDINKKVLAGNARAFKQVVSKANVYLQNTFGLELVELFPQNVDESAEKARKEGKRRQARNGDGDDEEMEDGNATTDAEDDNAGGSSKKKNKNKNKNASGNKGGAGRSTAAKMFCLRTTMPSEVIKQAVSVIESQEQLPVLDQRLNDDVHGSIGDAAPDDVKEWKRSEETILDWKTGPDQRTLMGMLFVILSLILVNERVLTDEQLMTHLKRLNLQLTTPLPLHPGTMHPEKQTVNTFLGQLIKQGYLEKTKLAAPSTKKAGGGGGSGTQATQSATQRVRATQATTQRSSRGDQDNEGINALGNSDEEWRWGPRAHKEIGESEIAAFIKDFYAAHPGADRQNAKAPAQLDKEIVRGANGGTAGRLANARDD